MPFKRTVAASVAAAALFAFSSSAGFAATPEEITAALTKVIQSGDSGATVTLGTPVAEGETLVYSNVSIKPPRADASPLTIAKLTLTGSDLNAEGGVTAESILAETITSTHEGMTLTIASSELTEVDLVAPPAPEQKGRFRFETFGIDALSVSREGKAQITIATIDTEATDYAGDVPRSLSSSLEGFVIDPTSFDDGGAMAAQLGALGYTTLTLSIAANGTWDDATGIVELEDFSVEGADMGVLSLDGTLGGFNGDVLAQLSQPNPPPTLLDSITLSNATLSYVDASLAGRLLDKQAKDMGQPRAEFVEQISAALPLLLTAIQNPPFQEQLAAAGALFLKDPKSLSITIAPAAPVPLSSVVGTAQTAPQTLPDTLKASIVANDPELDEPAGAPQ